MVKIHEEILDNLDEVVHLVDKNMKVLFVNKAIEKLSRGRVKKEEMIGKNLYEVFPFLKERGVDKEYENVFSKGKSLKTEEWTEYYGGKIYTITVKIPLKDKEGKIKQVLTIMRDFTETKKIEETLREVAEKYSAIVELVQEGICIDDENEKMIFVNDAFAKILNYEKDYLIGKSLFDFVDDEGRKILIKQAKLRRQGKSSRYELKVYTKNGQIRDLLISAVPLLKNGKYIGSISVNLDITERKRAEEKIRILLEREREIKMEMAHYFFNPIAIAKGYMYLIMENLPRNEKENLEKAINAVDRIENVVKNMVTKGEIHE